MNNNMILQRLHKLPPGVKKALLVSADLLLIPMCLWIALSLRYGFWYNEYSNAIFLFVALPLLSIPIFIRLGLYRAIMRYLGAQALKQIAKAVLFSSAILLGLMWVGGFHGLPRSLFLLYGFVAFVVIGGTRLLMRSLSDLRPTEKLGVPVAIYGAGAAGHQLARMLRAGREYRPVIFLDDGPNLHGREIDGMRVFDPMDLGLPLQLERMGVEQILLAIPSAANSTRSRILKTLEPHPFHIRSVPGVEEIISGARIDQLREIQVEDLLGRDPVPPDPVLMRRCITGKVVMVTGAGGSIGSELCRQILAQRPKKLLLFEQSEYALYTIESELRANLEKNNGIELLALLGNACEREHVARILQSYRVNTVFHAAAYKHVPLVEHNITEGVRNNIFGTLHTAEAAIATEVETFVFVSTDKAVRPTNVMGASKRFAELVLQGLAQEPRIRTNFCMVRFGNVLGSSGSVVPLFREQIESGGPVTVTHPKITRYFMTIPEAAQLVIQAGAMAHEGDLFVLDMGDPVRIADLAKSMVHLMGLQLRDDNHPHGDIEIIYTGLRPGEKLYEEFLAGDDVSGTTHPKILRTHESSLPWDEVALLLRRLERAIRSHDCAQIREVLSDAVNGYQPTSEIFDTVWRQSEQAVSVEKIKIEPKGESLTLQ